MKTLTIEEFVAILEAAGVHAGLRAKFHQEFERKSPEAHQAFLQWLGATPEHAESIRQRFRTG
jgi:MerR family transcriptional regulator, thiopeptide resistance regulator